MNNATKKKEKQFVYIVGPARSGSTITMFMLCDHPELVVWPQEIGFYTQFVNDFPKGGGLPIMVDGQIAGAVGVGGPQLQDECAQAGIDAVLAQETASVQ